MIYALVNPFDILTFEADDHLIASICCVLIGSGIFGVSQLDGDFNMPVLLFDNKDDWFLRKFNIEINESLLDKSIPEIINCLDSVLIGNQAARELFKEATKKMSPLQKQDYLKEYNKTKDPLLKKLVDIAHVLSKIMQAKKISMESGPVVCSTNPNILH